MGWVGTGLSLNLSDASENAAEPLSEKVYVGAKCCCSLGYCRCSEGKGVYVVTGYVGCPGADREGGKADGSIDSCHWA